MSGEKIFISANDLLADSFRLGMQVLGEGNGVVVGDGAGEAEFALPDLALGLRDSRRRSGQRVTRQQAQDQRGRKSEARCHAECPGVCQAVPVLE